MFAWFHAWRARQRMLAGPHYRDHILVLKSETPMALPPVREIHAVNIGPAPKKRKKRRAKRSTPHVLAMPKTGTR